MNKQSSPEPNGDQQRLEVLQQECERLQAQVRQLERERDNLKASLSQAETERDEYRKATSALLRELYPLDSAEIERWGRETLESYHSGDRFYSLGDVIRELEQSQGA